VASELAPGPSRLIVADDHPMFLDAIERMLSQEPGFEVIARCRDGIEVLNALQAHPADALVLDIRMPRKDGLVVLRELQESGCQVPVVVLTAELSDDELVETLRLGVRGLVLKDSEPRLLVQCLRKVHAGGRWLEEGCVVRVAEVLLRREAGLGEASRVLTPREVQIVRKVAVGLRNKAIAHDLCISEGTIKIHLHNIYEKVELDGRFALMHWARARGLA
jgi:DNA-binding NarL/FixJ family response regulator